VSIIVVGRVRRPSMPMVVGIVKRPSMFIIVVEEYSSRYMPGMPVVIN
jgi:hypothetical protein